MVSFKDRSADPAWLARFLRHIATGKGVPMYLTSIETEPAGPFRGKLVVSRSRRRMPSARSRSPRAFASPELIGIEDIDRPWAGDATEVRADELPVFWACGVTPQVAVRQARPPLCITHTPGHMVLTDLRNAPLAVL